MFRLLVVLGGCMTKIFPFSFVYLEGQVIKTNSTNILIRALQINKQKSDAKDVIAKSAADSSTVKRYYLLDNCLIFMLIHETHTYPFISFARWYFSLDLSPHMLTVLVESSLKLLCQHNRFSFICGFL